MTRAVTLVRSAPSIPAHPQTMGSEAIAVEMGDLEREVERLLGDEYANFRVAIREEQCSRRYRVLDFELKRRNGRAA